MISCRIQWALGVIFFFSIGALFISCDDEEDAYFTPKPRAYYRISFPERKYQLFDSTCPYIFEKPIYARIVKNPSRIEDCFFDIQFPSFKATLHMSYLPVEQNLAALVEKSHGFAMKHEIKASGLNKIPIVNEKEQVYGLVFEIDGNAASNYQFYLTDSTKHFVRGSFYFNSSPNIDSTHIVLQFLRKDMEHLIESFRWKKTDKTL